LDYVCPRKTILRASGLKELANFILDEGSTLSTVEVKEFLKSM
jgi:hypothetical protein